jgi:uncharacterized damage-inducible protein DinB
MDMIDRLLEHDRWATSQLLKLCQDLTDEQLDHEFDIGLRTIRTTFDHYIYNIEFWTALMKQEPLNESHAEERKQRSLPQLIKRHERAFDLFASTARAARDEGRLDETFKDHWDLPVTLGGSIIHVTLHNEMHRSEVVHMLTRIGQHEPPEVDHLLWEHVLHGRASL